MPDDKNEDLRQRLLDDVWAGAAAGMPAMLLDEDAIRRAGEEELDDLARRYGMKK